MHGSGEVKDQIGSRDKKQLFNSLVQLNTKLSKYSSSDDNYEDAFAQLIQIIDKIKTESTKKNETKTKEEDNELSTDEIGYSSNIFKILSRNIVMVSFNLPNKIYDLTNELLGNLQTDGDFVLSDITKFSILALIDLFEAFPTSLSSLTKFAVTQIHKILKKTPDVSSELLYLLNSVTKNSTKLDIDDKLQAKVMKVIIKNICLPTTTEFTNKKTESLSTILLKRNYFFCLRNMLILSISTNYENLLALSASSNSAGSKIKPESIMTQQNQFQLNILHSNEKVWISGLTSYSKEIRIAAVECIAYTLFNMIDTGKIEPLEYLIGQYPLPEINSWDKALLKRVDLQNDSLSTERKKDKNSINSRDSEGVIHADKSLLLLQNGIIESLIFYIQLKIFESPEFLQLELDDILECVLNKFDVINNCENHLVNPQWNRTLNHWTTFVDFIIKEGGSICVEMLAQYVFSKFNSHFGHDPKNEIHSRSATSKDKKRESLFTFKGSKANTKIRNTSESSKISIYSNPYQLSVLLHIIKSIIPLGVEFSSITEESGLNRLEENTKMDSTNKDESFDDSLNEIAKGDSFLKDLIFSLLINDTYFIRNHALNCLLSLAASNPVEINALISRAFKHMTQEYKNAENLKNGSLSAKGVEQNHTSLPSIKLQNYSLALSALIRQADSHMMQNSLIVKILSFCTQGLKHNGNSKRQDLLKNSSCWIVLTSLVTLYEDSEYVKLNSSQFLVFWKGLLTSQFISSSLNSNTEEGLQEIIDNLKLRNCSLVCLLNYINSVELSPEVLKQIRFLLTKSYNYLNFLESNIEGIGGITNFNSEHFNVYDYNINMLNNVHYTNYGSDNVLSSERMLISLIVYCKKILIQGFTKLANISKQEVNSNIVIFLVKLFGDSKNFSRIMIEDSKERPKSSKNKYTSSRLQDLDDSVILLHDELNYNFGVTSKFLGESGEIDELLNKSKYGSSNLTEDGISYKDPFSKKRAGYPPDSIEAHRESSPSYWFDCFEDAIYKSSENNIHNDPNILLLQRYSVREESPPSIVTSLIDLAIELFQLVFPNLSLKIQFSLLEQLRDALTTREVDPLRQKAVYVNISIALHGLLVLFNKQKYNMDRKIVDVILDILDKISLRDRSISEINSETMGMALKHLDQKTTYNYLSKLINDLVNTIDPYKRGFILISLAQIFKSNQIGFNDICNVVVQLLQDPNPVVYFYSLNAASTIVESSITNSQIIAQMSDIVYGNYLNDNFGYNAGNKILLNLGCQYSSLSALSNFMKIFITSLGPTIREWNYESKLKIKNLIISMAHGVGAVTSADYIYSYSNIMKLLKELMFFDNKLLDSEVKFFTHILDLIIAKNSKIGLSSTSPTSINSDAIFPFHSSFDMYRSAYECYNELLKVFGISILTKDSIKLFWVSMNLKPCEELKDLIRFWLESSININWFEILSSLFIHSSKSLVGPYLDVNYQRKLLPLTQRQKKSKKNSIEFRDEEVESIVIEEKNDLDKGDPISWEFKLLILDLLIVLLDKARKNEQLFKDLTNKLQDLVKISYTASTSPITTINLRGIDILDRALELFGDLTDPLYPGVSILEQQQAQIISALIPCFGADSNPEVIIKAINVSSKFINLPRIKFYSKQRILKTLIYLLEEVSSNKFLKFEFLENMSENNKKSIQISILNCWAILKINAQDSSAVEDELLEIIERYSKLLISLWILNLREYSSLKYSEINNRELSIYGNYWINFVSVLTIVLESKRELADEFLSEDADNFLFVLFSHCFESLTRNQNVTETLVSLNRLVRNPQLIEIIFDDEIFGEVIDLFDRLLLVDYDIEIRCQLVGVINNIFNTFLDNNSGSLDAYFDRLFELLRITSLQMFAILPFLRTDFDPTDRSMSLALKHVDGGPNLLLLKTVFSKLMVMVSKFPNVVRIDLYSCLLFIFAKIYEYGNELLISVVLPHLKRALTDLKALDNQIVQSFNNATREFVFNNIEKNHAFLTSVVLITVGDLIPNDEESNKINKQAQTLLRSSETAPMAIQGIKTIIQHFGKSDRESLVLKNLITGVFEVLVDSPISEVDLKVFFEIVFFFIKNYPLNDLKAHLMYSISIPLLMKHYSEEAISRFYTKEKLMVLVHNNSNAFKAIVNDYLSTKQKQLVKEILNSNSQSANENLDSSVEPEIQLKTFGAN